MRLESKPVLKVILLPCVQIHVCEPITSCHLYSPCLTYFQDDHLSTPSFGEMYATVLATLDALCMI